MNPPTHRQAVLLTDDLIYCAKIEGTASALSRRIAVADDLERALALCGQHPVGCIVLDLNHPDLSLPQAVQRLRAAAPEAVIIAYGPHVDAELLAAALAAGCEQVLPRNMFTAALPALLSRYLGQSLS